MEGYQLEIQTAYSNMPSFPHARVIKKYKEGWRFYHNVLHLGSILQYIEKDKSLSDEDRVILRFIAFYHDAIYIPTRVDNEEKSAQLFIEHACEIDLTHGQKNKIANGIRYTNLLSKSFSFEIINLYKRFVQYDTMDLIHCNFASLLTGEKNIQKEYQFVDWSVYKEKKIEFLAAIKNKNPEYSIACNFLKDFVMSRTPKIGIYAGSFNPFHVGHLSVLRQAEKIFDKVVIIIGVNPSKHRSIGTINNRYKKTKELLPYHHVDKFFGYITDYIKNLKYKSTLIRGIRTDTDFKKEQVQLRIMQDLYPDINVVFITCDKDVEHISSSSIRIMESIKEKSASRYILNTNEIYNGL